MIMRTRDGKRWTLCKQWTNGERTLNKRWTNGEHTLNKRWMNGEHTLNKRWTNGEHTLNKRWTNGKMASRTFEGLYTLSSKIINKNGVTYHYEFSPILCHRKLYIHPERPLNLAYIFFLLVPSWAHAINLIVIWTNLKHYKAHCKCEVLFRVINPIVM
jgi:hypothetical protein